jgi:hypothetical protein
MPRFQFPVYDEGCQPWRAFEAQPRDVQDRLVLEALGRSRFTNTQIRDSMVKLSPRCYGIHDSLRDAVKRLFEAGEIEREEGRWGPCRYRYVRRVPTDEIKAFERVLGLGSEAVH